jgi:hypothetical protein
MLVASAYFLVSVIIAISAGIHAGLSSALCAFGAPLLALAAAGGIKSVLKTGDKAQKIGTPIIGVGLLGLAYWIGGGFSVSLFGHYVTGHGWTVAGMVIGFLFAA